MSNSDRSLRKGKNHYLKDKKAQVFREVDVSMPGHMPKSVYQPITPNLMWCYVRQMSQQELFLSKGSLEHETRIFVFNYHREIDVDKLILYKGKWYQITRVDTPDDYNTDMFVYGKYIEGSVAPQSEDIIQYDENHR